MDRSSIPDVSHLEQIENSYVKVAKKERLRSRSFPVGDLRSLTKGDEIYVSYIIENDVIVAFGSAGYYSEQGNYYGSNNKRHKNVT